MKKIIPSYGDAQTARRLQAGLTLVPYWGHDKDGVRVALCCWDTLRPGETLADAAKRHSIPAPDPVWTPQLLERVAALEEVLGWKIR